MEKILLKQATMNINKPIQYLLGKLEKLEKLENKAHKGMLAQMDQMELMVQMETEFILAQLIRQTMPTYLTMVICL